MTSRRTLCASPWVGVVPGGGDGEILGGVGAAAQLRADAVAPAGRHRPTASRTLAEGFDHIRAAAQTLLERVATVPEAPDRVEMELGLKINAEAGAIVAKTSGEGNFLIRLS